MVRLSCTFEFSFPAPSSTAVCQPMATLLIILAVSKANDPLLITQKSVYASKRAWNIETLNKDAKSDTH